MMMSGLIACGSSLKLVLGQNTSATDLHLDKRNDILSTRRSCIVLNN
ncbi:hypothetical protein LSH36_908g00006 [Paralvinella palmiformis]|uniref:Uncharacterized protein n=1 Tax=Paralvinella palmiformis TaxID=53620 RepID=A0AAD9IY36_9ANNE|nr:hypothetical protein LSH36_908g00006 [Paralvinella palmiformis]